MTTSSISMNMNFHAGPYAVVVIVCDLCSNITTLGGHKQTPILFTSSKWPWGILYSFGHIMVSMVKATILKSLTCCTFPKLLMTVSMLWLICVSTLTRIMRIGTCFVKKMNFCFFKDQDRCSGFLCQCLFSEA